MQSVRFLAANQKVPDSSDLLSSHICEQKLYAIGLVS